MDTVNLRAIYHTHSALLDATPDGYRVEAMGGAMVVECATLEEALRYFHRWTEENES